MRIEHVSMYVSDLEGMKDFYCRFFHANSSELQHHSKTGMKTYFLVFDTGARLKLMYQVERQFDLHKQIRTGYSNLSFQVKNKEEIDQIVEKLKKGKFEILSGPKINADGTYECCFKDSEFNQVEIFVPSGS